MAKRFEQLSPDEFQSELVDITDKMCNLLSSKRRSYGPHNLTRFGLTGIVIRASDKIERLATMTQQGVQESNDGDSMEDALMDLIGYGILGLMYYRLNVMEKPDGTSN